ncbi:hypothetical protein [[Kitasatospora] papulosa]|uniref:hypothetical protein n=1 Tax=[Kitasatospora] papulosa TaxID=1464011 RepID=UPI0036BE6E44
MAVHSGEAALNSTKRLLLSPTEPTPVRKFIPQVDFELDDLDADEERYLDIYRKVAVHESMLVPLTSSCTVSGETSSSGSSIMVAWWGT